MPALLDEIARGFVDYSAGRVTAPPAGHLGFDDPPGDVHVKNGHVRGDDAFVIKVATGFPANAARGLPTGDGLLLAFDARTGVLGAGVQARLQLRLLGAVTPCREAVVWGRTRAHAESLAAEAARDGFRVAVADDAAAVAAAADLLVTATAARGPLFPADALRPGAHVTAVGADAPGKQELDPALFARAALVAARAGDAP